MFFVAFLSAILITTEQHSAKTYVCDGVIFNKVYFDKEILFTRVGRPYNLVMHKFSNVLFYSRTIVTDGYELDFGLKACDLDSKECHDIKGVPGGHAIAYDSGHDDIFFGGNDGIYKYNFLTKSGEYFAEKGKSIWGLFIRKNFYYIEYPTQRLFVYEDDNFVQVAEAYNIEIDNFLISKHQDVYYSNKTALYKVEKSKREPYVLSDEIWVRQIVEDNYGDIYFCATDGIYLEDKPYYKIKKVADIERTYGLAFDEHDLIIIGDDNTIIKLHPSNISEECFETLETFRSQTKHASKM